MSDEQKNVDDGKRWQVDYDCNLVWEQTSKSNTNLNELKKLFGYALYEEGAFAPNKYNRYDGTNDYQFMLDMFNKRNKSEITEQQHRKIRGLIAYSIKPFLRERLKYK